MIIKQINNKNVYNGLTKGIWIINETENKCNESKKLKL